MKKILFHILIPIILAILMFILSISYIFRIPVPGGGLSGLTYFVGFCFAIFVLAVSSIISVILYVGNKKK